MDIVIAPDAQTAGDEAASWLARQMRNAVSRRGCATVALSGGSTPRLMLASLSEMAVPWEATTLFQVDERVAPDGDPDRNAALFELVQGKGASIELMPVELADLDSAAAQYARLLPEMLDVVHLGIGDDGHTASWPPGDPVIDAPGSVAISKKFNGRVRMTLTVHAVNSARHRLVLGTGAAKASVVERWMLHDHALPIDRVNRANTMLVLDADAAARLPYHAR